MKKLITLITVLFTIPAVPCSTIGVPFTASKYMGKNYDWMLTMGRVYVNARGVQKTALVFSASDTPAQWISAYGSVTFNQYGREFPNGGMNEAGLAIEIMWLTSSIYPTSDARPTVNELQWIQYMLDTYDNVKDMVLNAHALRISKVTAAVHYLACDRTGQCASFENIGGTMIATLHDQRLSALTNNTYQESLNALSQHVGFGGTSPVPQDTSSLSRFVRGVSLAQNVSNFKTREDMFSILDSVAQSNTVWQIAYNIDQKFVHFRTNEHRDIKSLDLNTLNYECDYPVLTIDMQKSNGGLINEELELYTEQANLALVEAAINGLPLPLTPAMRKQMILMVSQYPATATACIL